MRRTHWAPRVFALASGVLVLALGGCSDATTPGTPTNLPAAEVSDIGAAEGDEVEQAVGALTTPLTEGVASPTAPGCDWPTSTCTCPPGIPSPSRRHWARARSPAWSPPPAM